MTKTGDAAKPPMDLELHAESLLDSMRSRSRELGIAAVGVALVAGGIYLWQQQKHANENKAELALANPASAFFQGNAALAKSDLQKLVERYSDTPAGVQGSMMLAQVLFQEGKFDEGVKTLQKAQGSSASGPFNAPLQALIGEGLLDGKKYVEAAKAFQDAAAKTSFAADKDVYSADAARALTLAGKTEEAKKLWSDLAAKRESPVLAEARVRLGELEGKK
ncbi:MAG: tetratricopeptide repeat protein [bacterium]|jgi:predicted negative regulator of RcsB-dependent stress response